MSDSTDFFSPSMDRYDNLTKIGMSKVGPAFRADDKMTGQPVVLKVVSTEGASHPLDPSRVAQLAGPLMGVGGFNIARLVELTQIPEGMAVVSEFVAGPSVAAAPDKGKIKGAGALDVANQLINALCDGERLRIPHGDIKPSNVLLATQPDGRPHVKVTDWGLAAARSEPTPESLLFTAPERLEGGPASVRADLFSAGAVLFFYFTGMSLVSGRGVAEISAAWKKASPEHLKKIRKDLPAKLVKLVISLLETKPEKRPSSAAAVAKDLASMNPPSLPQPVAPQPAPSQARGPATAGPVRPGAPTGGRPTQPGRPVRPGAPGVRPGVMIPGRTVPASVPPAAQMPVAGPPVVPLAPQVVPLPEHSADVAAIDPSQLIVVEPATAAPPPVEIPAVPDGPVTVVPMRPPPEIAAKMNLPTVPAQPVPVAPGQVVALPQVYGQPYPPQGMPTYPPQAPYPPQSGYPPQGYPVQGYPPQQGHPPYPAYPPAPGYPSAYGAQVPMPHGAATHPIITGAMHPAPAGVRTQPFHGGAMPYAAYPAAGGYPGGPQIAGRMMQPPRSKLPLIIILIISTLTLGGGGYWLFRNWERLTSGDKKEEAPITNTNDLAEKLREKSAQAVGAKKETPKGSQPAGSKK